MVDYREDAFQRIVNVNWPAFRYYIGISYIAQQGWDGGFSPVEGFTYDMSAISSPFSPMELIGYRSSFSPGPVDLLTFPSGDGRISSVGTEGTLVSPPYQELSTGRAWKDNTLKQWRWKQWDSNNDTGPFFWQCNDDAILNANLIPVGSSINLTIALEGHRVNANVLTIYMMRIKPSEFDDDEVLDFNTFDIRFKFGPSANLGIGDDAGSADLSLLRVSRDVWLFSGPEAPEAPLGWFIDNTPFAP